MQIVTLNLDTLETEDFEPKLRPLADSDDPLAAAKGQMLLNLIRHLRKSGPEPQAYGFWISDELYLNAFASRNSATVRIRPDWYDYPLVDGRLPRMHYRINVKAEERELSCDIRTDDLEEVERVVREAFGWHL